MTFGHEVTGVVEEVGGEVGKLKVGDRVLVPFNIACGHVPNNIDELGWKTEWKHNRNALVAGTAIALLTRSGNGSSNNSRRRR